MVDAMNAFEWRILTHLRENRGKPLTAYQIANNDETTIHRVSMANSNRNSNDVQLARKALDNLAAEGYIVKQSRKKGTSSDVYYFARL